MAMWPLRLFKDWDSIYSLYGFVPVGAIWPDPVWRERHAHSGCLGAHYLKDWAATRDPLVVMLPVGTFCIDSRAYNTEKGYHGNGWQVTGTAPLITLSPSIDMGKNDRPEWHYHGHITGGVIQPDIEGRMFPQARGFP